MADTSIRFPGTQPPPEKERGHSYPRRTTPEQSITLMHHRIARDASLQEPPAPPQLNPKQSRRDSSGDTQATGISDPKKWFDRANHNAGVSFDAGGMDVDPPFFQKETDSSNEGNISGNPQFAYVHGASQAPFTRPTIATHSSSADDYRSVIDDLTIENKRLKEELKRYKQFGPGLLQKDKLFEIRMHGLPKRKKRELEATLRNFAASLGGGSTDASSQQFAKPPRHGKNKQSRESHSKHESSSSSHSRPADSAYASMSTGPSSSAAHSSGLSLHQPPALPKAKGLDAKVEKFLRDFPEGLQARNPDLTENEKKKLIVRRLEQLFTGTAAKRDPTESSPLSMGEHAVTKANLEALPEEAADGHLREAMIQLPGNEQQRKNRSQDNLSTAHSGDLTESRDNGTGSGRDSGDRGKTSENDQVSSANPPEQRVTRPFDLDPDRVQVGADNMDYIRHLGLVPPELLVEKKLQHQNVSVDATGWVYINLLSSMAQLHMLNVTPDFILQAVTEKSTKFQVSPDRRKIRWRGSRNGTKFSSDSSGESSQRSPLTEDTDGSNEDGQRKKFKTYAGAAKSVHSSKNASGSGKQASASSDSFHYKPLFVHQSSSNDTSWAGSGSPASYVVEDSNLGNTSGWGASGSGSSNQRRKRKHDGAVIYYSGAPFCTDFSGDSGDMSPAAHMGSSAREMLDDDADTNRPVVFRSLSGSSIPFRPITDRLEAIEEHGNTGMADQPPELETDDGDTESDIDAEFPWSSEDERADHVSSAIALDACGLGGVLPEDHFAVHVTTRRTVIIHAETDSAGSGRHSSTTSRDSADSIVARLAQVATNSPVRRLSLQRNISTAIEIEYLQGRIKIMQPAVLPPPSMFFPPFSSDSDTSDDDNDESNLEDDSYATDNLRSIDPVSAQAYPHLSDHEYSDHADLSSNDEEDEFDMREGFDPSPVPRQADEALTRPAIAPRTLDSGSPGAKSMDARGLALGSSAATAGGEESGYSSSMEDD
jgi:hypothetical protein